MLGRAASAAPLILRQLNTAMSFYWRLAATCTHTQPPPVKGGGFIFEILHTRITKHYAKATR